MSVFLALFTGKAGANELPALHGFVSQERWRATVSRKVAKTQSKPVNRFNQWKCHQCRKRKEEERTHTAWAGSDSYSLDTWLAATQVGDTATCLRKTIQGHASSIDRSTCRLRLHAVPIVAGKAVGLRPSGINRMVDQRLQ